MKVRSVAKVVRGSSPRPAGDPRYFNGRYLAWITVADCTRKDGIYLDRTEAMLTVEGARHTRILEANTLLLTNSGATLGVPKITRIRAGANDGIAAFLELKGVDRLFLYYVLEAQTAYLRQRLAPGVGQPNLNTSLIGDLEFLLPPAEEQRRVAECLSTWDDHLARMRQLAISKRLFRAGVIQQVLSGQRRLRAHRRREWKPVRLSDVLVESRDIASTGTLARKLTVKLYGRGVVSKHDRRIGSQNTQYYRRRAGQFIYSKLDFLNGAFGIIPAELDGYESTLDLPAFDVSQTINIRWLLHLFSWRGFYKSHVRLANGGRKARRVNPGELLKQVLSVPSREEQDSIAELLDRFDREIALIEQLLNAGERQKRALLEKLLSGELRLTRK